MSNIIFLKCNIWKRLLLKYREIVIYLEKQILLRKIENADTFDPVHWHSITQNLAAIWARSITFELLKI